MLALANRFQFPTPPFHFLTPPALKNDTIIIHSTLNVGFVFTSQVIKNGRKKWRITERACDGGTRGVERVTDCALPF